MFRTRIYVAGEISDEGFSWLSSVPYREILR
jgi:hypothetical protein